MYEAIPCLIFRATDENTRLGLFFDFGGGNVHIYREEAGALTTVATSPVGKHQTESTHSASSP